MYFLLTHYAVKFIWSIDSFVPEPEVSQLAHKTLFKIDIFSVCVCVFVWTMSVFMRQWKASVQVISELLRSAGQCNLNLKAAVNDLYLWRPVTLA